MIFDLPKYNSQIALITDQGEQYSYHILARITDIFTQRLKERGLVFCLCKNNIESLLCYLGCLQANVPVVLLDASKPHEVIQSLIDIYKPKYLWLPTRQCQYYKGKVGEMSMSYSLMKLPNRTFEMHPDLALCLTTSGTTGSPKLVRLTKQNILSNALSIAEYLHIDENERPITMLPMYYSYGLSIINSHLIQGATILLTDKTYAQRDFWNFLKENNATSMSGVPYTWEMLKRLRFMRMDLPSVRTMTQAGGRMQPELAKEYIDWAKEQGKQFIVMYGQTEATARMSYLPWEAAQEKYASIGKAIPGGEFSLADDGELIYKGANVSMGYAECAEDLLKGDENHGVLHTGDLARKDEDGFYYIIGRKKRFVKVWGNRCNLDAVEQMVRDMCNVLCVVCDVAVTGIDDKITVWITNQEEQLHQQIVKELSNKTKLHQSAFYVNWIHSIPKSEAGKTLYSQLNS